MSKLLWESMLSPMKGMQMWGANDAMRRFIISKDTGCAKDDPCYGRFTASFKGIGQAISWLGTFDTLEEAQNAVEQARRPS